MRAQLGVVTGEDEWRALEARREDLGADIAEVAEEAGYSREWVGKILSGQAGSDKALRKVARALDALEAESGRGRLVPKVPGANLVKFTIHGVYGAAEVIVEGPVENMEELQAAVDKLLRGQHDKKNGSAE